MGVSANENIELNLPRNAVGANLSLKIINVIHNINKFIGHGETKAKQLEKMLMLSILAEVLNYTEI